MSAPAPKTTTGPIHGQNVCQGKFPLAPRRFCRKHAVEYKVDVASTSRLAFYYLHLAAGQLETLLPSSEGAAQC